MHPLVAHENATSVGRAWLKPNSITLAGSEPVRSWFEAKFHYTIWIEPASNRLRTR